MQTNTSLYEILAREKFVNPYVDDMTVVAESPQKQKAEAKPKGAIHRAAAVRRTWRDIMLHSMDNDYL